eukprot:TRINITY_DN121_c0_g1_i16.p1 TRINITY_DN121_c0_g1~~TRINITY_DN121_c0_g1_i16.p1  ORF type:complete len:270 (+),score=-8.10 TRINITY_DN121_c0_g1_i16:793-1602(+)
MPQSYKLSNITYYSHSQFIKTIRPILSNNCQHNIQSKYFASNNQIQTKRSRKAKEFMKNKFSYTGNAFQYYYTIIRPVLKLQKLPYIVRSIKRHTQTNYGTYAIKPNMRTCGRYSTQQILNFHLNILRKNSRYLLIQEVAFQTHPKSHNHPKMDHPPSALQHKEGWEIEGLPLEQTQYYQPPSALRHKEGWEIQRLSLAQQQYYQQDWGQRQGQDRSMLNLLEQCQLAMWAAMQKSLLLLTFAIIRSPRILQGPKSTLIKRVLHFWHEV